MLRKNEDFITQVADFIEDTTMTSRAWSECVATSLLSTVMGPEKFISDRMSKLNMNVWFLMVGPSGLAKKSLPLKSYLFPILLKVSDYLPDNYPIILPSRFSVEGLIEYLSEKSMGCIARDEFTSMFKEAYNKRYLSDAIEFLSELYDGTIQKRSTISHGTHEIRNVYVTFIAATTPHLYKVMKPDFFVQGTGNRILYEVYEDRDLPPIDPDDFFKGPIYEEEKEGKIESIAETLAKIRHSNVQYLIPDEEASEIWTKYEYEKRNEARRRFNEDNYDLHYTYISRMAEMVLKMSGLRAISRAWNVVIRKDMAAELIILESDMDWAIRKVEHHYEQFCRMLDNWRVRPEPLAARTLNEQAFYVIEKLKDKERGVPWWKLRKSTKWEVSTWREVLKYLWDTNSVRIVEGESTGGRKPILFYDISVDNIRGVELKDLGLILQRLHLR